MALLYSISINFYAFLIKLTTPWSAKAKSFSKGREKWKEKLKTSVSEKENIIWFHVSSLGEYEQALPLIEMLNSKRPEKNILISFFSPSGYENAKIPEYVMGKVYLPIDTKKNAAEFINISRPELAVFVKYDIWYFYLKELKSNKIPSVLISALFRDSQVYFKAYGSIFRQALACFDKIYVQNEHSKNLLEGIKIASEVSGDTRYDRVNSRLKNIKSNSVINSFKGDSKIFLIGSSWMDDLNIIMEEVNKLEDFKVIIAPHNIGRSEIDAVDSKLRMKCERYSAIRSEHEVIDLQALIIDNIGMLAMLYSVADIAYVGGAFHGSLHNILEPAVFGIPIIFGPKHEKFPEAREMIESKCAFSISNRIEFSEVLNSLKEDKIRSEAGKKASDFVQSKLGSTQNIYEGLESFLS